MKILILLFLLLPSIALANTHKQDVLCMSLNIYYEARFENDTGQMATGFVTLNRSRYWHKGICNVVFAKNQFSWVKQVGALDENGKLRAGTIPKKNNRLWRHSQWIAEFVLSHPNMDFTQGSQWFIARGIFPKCLKHSCKFTKNLQYVGMFGTQLFFNKEDKYHVYGK